MTTSYPQHSPKSRSSSTCTSLPEEVVQKTAFYVETERCSPEEMALLKPHFLADLRLSQAPIHQTLEQLLTDDRNRLKFLCHRILPPKPFTFLKRQKFVVMIRGNNDFELKKLGERYGFPRGFPLVWTPGGSTPRAFKAEQDEQDHSLDEVKTPQSSRKSSPSSKKQKKKDKQLVMKNDKLQKSTSVASQVLLEAPGADDKASGIPSSVGEVVSYGFYPKFDNDTALPKIKLEDYANAEKLSFFRKWSGFLSMVVAFDLEVVQVSSDSTTHQRADKGRLLTSTS
ncbi:unnamed protein product, partial [Amoebophrya sp. A120]|eukprot:GSA120T00005869001.1